MTHFRVGPVQGAKTDQFWVTASSEGEARLIVSRTVPQASEAVNPLKYVCVPDSEYQLPLGVILGGGGNTYTALPAQ